MKPTPHYEAHHDLDAPQVDAGAFRPGWRVRTRLDGLLASHDITATVWRAAVDYRDTWARMLRLRTMLGAPAGRRGAGGTEASMLAVLGAAQRIRVAEQQIHPKVVKLLHVCILEDASWREIGRRYRVAPMTARGWMVEALRVLATAWTGESDP